MRALKLIQHGTEFKLAILLANFMTLTFLSFSTAQDTIRWSQQFLGEYSEPTNWENETVPGPNDTALFGALLETTVSNPNTVLLDQCESNQSTGIVSGNFKFCFDQADSFTTQSLAIGLNVSKSKLPNFASLTVESIGPTSINTQSTFVGSAQEYAGDLTIIGPNLVWNAPNETVIGFGADGDLTLQTGAELHAGLCNIAFGDSVQGDVNVQSGSYAEFNQGMRVGFDGSGSIRVSGAGELSTLFVETSRNKGSQGLILVSDPGSLFNVDEDMFIGGSVFGPGGLGQVSVVSGGQLDVGSRLILLQPNSELNLFEPKVAKSGGTVRVGEPETFNLPGSVVVGCSGRLEGLGTIHGDVLIENNGLLSPGNEIGSIEIDGDLTVHELGEVKIGIGSQGTDLLFVSGTATLDGLLTIEKEPGFKLPPDPIDIICVEGRIESPFPLENISSIGFEKNIQVIVKNNKYQLRSVEVLIGDVNLDGQVNLLDVAPFIALIINEEFQIEADVNEDLVVDLLDVAPFVELLTGG